MNSMKRIFKYLALYLACLAGITAVVYICIAFFSQKTFYLEKKQWHPAEPETQGIDPARLNKALDYVETRLPTARSLLLLRNGRTVVEKYYWRAGPGATDYLHSVNLPLLQLLIGIAIDQKLIRGPAQPLSSFFRQHIIQTPTEGDALLTLDHLLKAQAPILWGRGSHDYWKLFYAEDRIAASLSVLRRQQTREQSALTHAAAYLLGQVIEQVSGQSVFHFADRYLFKPLGIATYADEGDDLPRDPMVGFQLKALDLAKIGYLLVRKGAWEGRQIISGDWVQKSLFKAAYADMADIPGGGWAKTTIREHTGFVARGDGGQYLVLVPALHVVLVTTSNSRFPLPQDNGRDRLLQLVVEAVLESPGAAAEGDKKGKRPDTKNGRFTDATAPNYVFSTPVPQDILDFFNHFARDIATRDSRRIARHYARAYDHTRDMFATPSRLLFGGSPPLLEYVHITRIRIERNRAYLRGRLKFAHRTYAGPQGVYPLENLIKLKGRWRWLGLPEKTALLDHEDYFDAELSQAQKKLVDDCSKALFGASSYFGEDCFAGDIQAAGGGNLPFAQRLQPFLPERSNVRLHVTGLQPIGRVHRVRGYIEGSALGELCLPNGLSIIEENGAWKWQGVVDTWQTEKGENNKEL